MNGENKRIPSILPLSTGRDTSYDRAGCNINCNFDQMMKLMTRAMRKKPDKEPASPFAANFM